MTYILLFMSLNRDSKQRKKHYVMTPEQVRIVKAEMMRYGVELQSVSAVFGIDPSAVSHAIRGKLSRSQRIREMIARMVLAKKLKIDPDDVPQGAITAWVAEFFPEG